MPTSADQPFAEWSYAVHCCRECLRTLLPGWIENGVMLSDDRLLPGLWYSAVTPGGTRHFSIRIERQDIADGDEGTALAVADQFDELLSDLGMKPLKRPNRFVEICGLPPIP